MPVLLLLRNLDMLEQHALSVTRARAQVGGALDSMEGGRSCDRVAAAHFFLPFLCVSLSDTVNSPPPVCDKVGLVQRIRMRADDMR